jgi:hypothetical protein
MNTTWTFPYLEVASVNGQPGVIRRIHWSLEASRDGITVRTYGICDLDLPGETFTALADVTDEMLLAWIGPKHDLPGIYAGLHHEVERFKTNGLTLVAR